MALETAGGIASIAAIIIDAASIFLRLLNQIQEIPQALDELQADIGRLEKALTLLQDAGNDRRESHPQSIPNDAKEIVKDCKRLRLNFATEVNRWTRNRYIFGYDWRFMYLFCFRQRRMKYMSDCVQNCLTKISVVASIAAWHDLIRQAAVTQDMEAMISANHADTVNSLKSLEEGMTRLFDKLEDLQSDIGTESTTNEQHRLESSKQQQETNKTLRVLTEIATSDSQTFQERVSAAKDEKQRTAVEKGTAGLRTDHSDNETEADN